MIERLFALNGLSQKLGTQKNFNATLPILLEVLQKTKSQYYLLKVGNQVLETKSLKELEIGKKYYALMRSNALGKMMLSDLQLIPQMPTKLPFALPALEMALGSPKGMEELKETTLLHLAKAQSKEEFLSLSFFLLGMQKGILSFWVEEREEKKRLIQLKPKKKEIEFYACFPHLGAMQGKVYDLAEGLHLELFVGYESIVEFLKSHHQELRSFKSLHIALQKGIAPLFVFENQLLDLRA